MSDSTRYFQLTPDILVEYNYFSIDNIQEQESDVSDRIIDFNGEAYVINNSYCATRTFFWNTDDYPYVVGNNGERYEYYYKNLKSNFVLPVNKSESKFVQCVNKYNPIWEGGDYNIKISNPIFTQVNNNDNDDVLCDNFRLHFTSRNYLGNNDYDGFIITVHIYDKVKNKIGLLSKCIKKIDDPNINENPVIINQKLYTTHMDFIIPNVSALLNSDLDWVNESSNGSEKTLCKALSPKYGLLDNTPIVMSIYGIKATVEKNNYEYFITEKLNSIYIPIIDKSSSCSINISQATDGDYFEIYPEFKNNRISFSDYVYNLSKDENGDVRPELYIVFHELTLTEHYTDNLNQVHNDITHREQFIINAKHEVTTNGEITTEVDENELDRHIYYRPVLRNTGKILGFTIEVKTHIINTLDNTTIVMNASADFDKDTAKKYGKRMSKIYLGDVPAKVNVYNKKPDIDLDGVKITNASSNVKIENHQHSVIGFIECVNVGVSIEQIPTELLQ